MATRKPAVKKPEPLAIVNTETGELKDLPVDVLPNRDTSRIPEDGAYAAIKDDPGPRDWIHESVAGNWKAAAISLVCIAAGCVLGIFGQPIIERQTQAASLYKAMQTAIPVVRAEEVAIDPGKFVGKLTDVVMTPTTGAVFKSRKGLFLAENSLGLSLTIFESAFEVFEEAYGVQTPDDIAPYLIGKTIKARGVVQQRMQPDGTFRTSMIIAAPGLIQILPEK